MNIEFADLEAREMIEEERKARLKLPYKVEVEWLESGGIWVGMAMGSSDDLMVRMTIGHKFDAEDSIGDVQEWILQVRLGGVK